MGGKKIGFFQEEKKYFIRIANDLNIKINNHAYWYRYPLAFLTKASDDICYSIIGVEDGLKLGYIKFNDAADVLIKLANLNIKTSNKKQDNDYIAHLRALAIGNLIDKISDVFIADKESILCGGREKSLISDIDLSLELEETKKLSRKYIFESIEVNGVELAGYAVINGLLSMFAPAILSWQEKNIPVAQLKGQDKKLLLLLGDKLDGVESQYSGLLRLTDYISGMTNTFCIDLYRRLKGITL